MESSTRTRHLFPTIFLVILMLSAQTKSLAEEKWHDWQKGLLLDTSVQSRGRIFVWRGDLKTINQEFWTYTIDSQNKVYEAMIRQRHRLKIEVQGPVEFAVDGDYLFLRCNAKDYKLEITKVTRK